MKVIFFLVNIVITFYVTTILWCLYIVNIFEGCSLETKEEGTKINENKINEQFKQNNLYGHPETTNENVYSENIIPTKLLIV